MDVQTLAASLALGKAELNKVQDIIAPAYSANSIYHIGDFCIYGGHLYRCIVEITTVEEFTAAHWEQHSIEYYLGQNESMALAPRFGAMGIGRSNPTLTRLWDAVGKSATPSTDLVAGVSDFDHYAPFNRRKCVGTWSAGTGKAVFTVNAYEGDADYAEDGSMGDYVAVDVTPFYYVEDGEIIGVSEYCWPGWSIHPVCVDYDGNIRPHTYLPVYGLAQNANGKAVSLPGYQNQRGSYKDLWDYAATYNDNGAADYAILEPSAVDHYEWLLMTIEYATQNMQTVMNGAVSMRYNTNDIVVAVPAANKAVIGSTGSNFVVGQTIVFAAGHSDNVNVSNYNCITTIEKCNADGTLNASGAYYLITYDGTDRSTSIVVDSWRMASRPWITGATAGYAHSVPAVLGHTGSPISLTSDKYPIRYRWRENPWGNQNMTSIDLANARIEDDTDVYHLDWYYLEDPRKMTHVNFDKTVLDDSTNGWVKLGVTTPSARYVNGYIKELAYDDRYPHVKIPALMSGGSASTYYCDYASLVHSYAVRSVRRRGYLNDGAHYGPRCFSATTYPSHASWYYGGQLFFIQ